MTEWLLFFNAFLLGRWFWIGRETAATVERIFLGCLPPLCVCALLTVHEGMLMVLVAVVLSAVVAGIFEARLDVRGGSMKGRFASFLIGTLLGLFAFNGQFGIEFSMPALEFVRNGLSLLVPGGVLPRVDGQRLLLLCAGAIFLAGEANVIVRRVLHSLELEPTLREGGARDTDAMRRGRLIGLIERLLIYVFILTNQVTAIAFVVAAKTLVRFKELETRSYAEYVLIGTFVSTGLAALTAFLVGMFI